MEHHGHVVKTKHAELTLEQLAEAQPGIARLMKEVGERFHVLYFAAKAGNWKLAQYEVNVVTSILKTGGTLRPKFAQDFTSFTVASLQPISDSIKAKDWTSFETAYKKSVDEANKSHEKYGYGFVRYVLPKTPPEHLDLVGHD